MRIDILAIGSRGDVQPYVALGLGLRFAGHHVRIVTLGGFEDLVRSRGLDHLVIGDTPQEIAGTAEGREWVRQRATPLGFLRGFVRVANSLIEEGISAAWNACRDTEALIVSPMGRLVGDHLAERLGVPLIRAQLVPPVLPTRYSWDCRRTFATAIQGTLATVIDGAFNLLIWSRLRPSVNAARRKVLGLPELSLTAPVRRAAIPLLAAYSPAVAPPLPDWDAWVHVTGYWFLDDLPGWTPPLELLEFLAAGPAPVFIGFGSTPFPEPEAATRLVINAVERAGRRGILLAGGSGLATGQLSPSLLSLDSVPHSWLFPRVSAAVHHGGAGVTGAALRAGLPSVVVPVFADQPFWGKRVCQLGAGPAPVPAGQLTEENLSAAIRATGDEFVRRRAAALGEQIRGEDGVARAVQLVEQYLGKGAANTARYHHAS